MKPYPLFSDNYVKVISLPFVMNIPHKPDKNSNNIPFLIKMSNILKYIIDIYICRIFHLYSYILKQVHTKKLKETKTASSNRKIKLDDHTINMLKEYKKQNKDRHPTFLFLDSNHNHASNSAVNKALKKACQRAGIKKITFHSLRHTHCSILLFQGINIHYISKRLGHSKVSITMDIYSHMLQEMDQRENKKATEVMGSLYE